MPSTYRLVPTTELMLSTSLDISIDGHQESAPGNGGGKTLCAGGQSWNWRMVVTVHGGGRIIGSLDAHERLVRVLERESGFAVVSIGDRLAPEHPFPMRLDGNSDWRMTGAILGSHCNRLGKA